MDFPVLKFDRNFKLPEMASYSIQNNGLTFYTGTIYRRKLKRKSNHIFWHYAFFYGVNESGEIYIIENDDKAGVQAVNWVDPYNWEVFHVELTDEKFETIKQRVKERADYFYNPEKNNCEHFVNYCVFGELKSIQVKNVRQGVNAFFLFLEAKYLHNSDARAGATLLKGMNRLRLTLGVFRNDPELDKSIDKHIKENQVQ